MPRNLPKPGAALLLAAGLLLAAPAPAQNPTAPAVATNVPAPSSGGPSWLPLALSVLSLALASLALVRSNKRKPKRRSSYPQPPSTPVLGEQAIRDLVRQEVRRELSKPVPAPVAATAAPKPKPNPAAGAPAAAPAEAPAAAEADASASVVLPVAPAPPAAPATQKLYANQQPIDGVFQRGSLAGAPAAYTIYELTVDERSPGEARFAVTGNPTGHAGFIGSHQSILGGACTYSSPQGSVSRIVTDVPGLAQRTPSGDWQITQKAYIHFS